jgi:host factor-I protein
MSKINIQDQLLYQARKERVPVKIFLVKGLQLNGRIAAYDMYSVLLESQGRLQLIFKHAISTIDFPEKIKLTYESGRSKTARDGAEHGATAEAPPAGASEPDGDGASTEDSAEG